MYSAFCRGCKKRKGRSKMKKTSNDNKLRRLTYAAVFAAIVCVMTMIVKVPTPTKGYMNLGDVAVLLAGFMLGGVYGGAAAGVGSALADLFAGYMVYAPATFVIKWLTAAVAAIIFGKTRRGTAAAILSGIVGEAVMVLGYFVFEIFISGGAAAALTGVPMNLLQGAVGVILSTLLYSLLKNKIDLN